ncbi:UPF0147 family protein [Candidatus Micrarchaeota archaeon]|nr:UPF0147 family protein [Candidatus Micrarchaeota archaeon]
MDVNKKISDLIEVIQPLSEDNSLPKNIRRSLNEAIKHLKSDDEPLAKLGAAVYVIEELTEDINLPPHARTQIWNILTALESILTDVREHEK